jgi:protein-tyrosine phosphatase
METQIIRMDASRVDLDALDRASETLRGGGLVTFPTETVYGVAARADDLEAVDRLRAVKGRGAEKAFTVHIASRNEVTEFVPRISGLAARLARKGWPGPLTLIAAVDDPLSAPVMAGKNDSVAAAIYYNNTVGLRCPDDRVAFELLRRAGGPVIAASANKAGQPPATSGTEALEALNDQVDMLIDTGETKYAKPSTIVRAGADSYEILRDGVYDAGIVERMSTLRILFVCTGNTCRSPMAAAIAERIIAERLGCRIEDLPGHRVIVESAGTSGGIGGAAENAVKAMSARGLDVTHHVSRALSADLARQADYVFVMTRVHRDVVMRLAPQIADRVRLVMEDQDVPDPLGGSEADYARCADQLESALRTRLQEVVL